MSAKSFLFLIVLALSSAFGMGQAAKSEPYKIKPGDVIDVFVAGQLDLNKTLTVLPDGSVSYPYAGELTVSGLTTNEAAATIQKALSPYYVRPIVTVSVSKMEALRASVVGAIKEPGQFDIKPGWRLLDLISAAGGLIAERPEWIRASIVRSGEPTIPVDLSHAMLAEDDAANVELKPNDILMLNVLDEAKTKVQVLGEVQKPGAVIVPEDGSFGPVLAAAQGLTPKAAGSRATILRGNQTIPVDLNKVLKGGEDAPDVRLQAGDTLVIPENRLKIAVIGAVQLPGSIDVPEGKDLTVLDALSLAGGQSQNGDLRSAKLVRLDKKGVMESSPIDLEKMLKTGDPKLLVVMQPGEVLYVPSKREGFKLGDLFPIFGIVDAIARR